MIKIELNIDLNMIDSNWFDLFIDSDIKYKKKAPKKGLFNYRLISNPYT